MKGDYKLFNILLKKLELINKPPRVEHYEKFLIYCLKFENTNMFEKILFDCRWYSFGIMFISNVLQSCVYEGNVKMIKYILEYGKRILGGNFFTFKYRVDAKLLFNISKSSNCIRVLDFLLDDFENNKNKLDKNDIIEICKGAIYYGRDEIIDNLIYKKIIYRGNMSDFSDFSFVYKYMFNNHILLNDILEYCDFSPNMSVLMYNKYSDHMKKISKGTKKKIDNIICRYIEELNLD